MTFLDILKEYDKEHEIIYPSDYYNDMRKKLLVAFECLGLFDLTIFKAENGKDYDFFETSKEYIFHLLKSETSPLFRNIKGNKMTMDDYISLASEVEQLFDFIKPYTKDEEEYKEIIYEISSNVRYPILKRFASIQNTYYSLLTYYESIIKDTGEVTEIDNWCYLTADDKVKLFDELITATKKWVNLVEKIGEYRADEVSEAIENASVENIATYVLVENAIAEEYCKAYKARPQPDFSKSRSGKALVSKIKSREDEVYNLKLDLAKKYCDTHNIDFQQYLNEKEFAEAPDFTPSSTESVFETIQNYI